MNLSALSIVNWFGWSFQHNFLCCFFVVVGLFMVYLSISLVSDIPFLICIIFLSFLSSSFFQIYVSMISSHYSSYNVCVYRCKIPSNYCKYSICIKNVWLLVMAFCCINWFKFVNVFHLNFSCFIRYRNYWDGGIFYYDCTYD